MHLNKLAQFVMVSRWHEHIHNIQTQQKLTLTKAFSTASIVTETLDVCKGDKTQSQMSAKGIRHNLKYCDRPKIRLAIQALLVVRQDTTIEKGRDSPGNKNSSQQCQASDESSYTW